MQVVEVAAFASFENLWPLGVVNCVAVRADAVFQGEQRVFLRGNGSSRRFVRMRSCRYPGLAREKDVVRMKPPSRRRRTPCGGQRPEHCDEARMGLARSANSGHRTRQRNRAGRSRRLQSPAAPWSDRNADRIRLRRALHAPSRAAQRRMPASREPWPAHRRAGENGLGRTARERPRTLPRRARAREERRRVARGRWAFAWGGAFAHPRRREPRRRERGDGPFAYALL